MVGAGVGAVAPRVLSVDPVEAVMVDAGGDALAAGVPPTDPGGGAFACGVPAEAWWTLDGLILAFLAAAEVGFFAMLILF